MTTIGIKFNKLEDGGYSFNEGGYFCTVHRLAKRIWQGRCIVVAPSPTNSGLTVEVRDFTRAGAVAGLMLEVEMVCGVYERTMAAQNADNALLDEDGIPLAFYEQEDEVLGITPPWVGPLALLPAVSATLQEQRAARVLAEIPALVVEMEEVKDCARRLAALPPADYEERLPLVQPWARKLAREVMIKRGEQSKSSKRKLRGEEAKQRRERKLAQSYGSKRKEREERKRAQQEAKTEICFICKRAARRSSLVLVDGRYICPSHPVRVAPQRAL